MNEDKAVPSTSPQLQEPKSIEIKVPKSLKHWDIFGMVVLIERVILTNDAGEWDDFLGIDAFCWCN